MHNDNCFELVQAFPARYDEMQGDCPGCGGGSYLCTPYQGIAGMDYLIQCADCGRRWLEPM